LDFFNSTNITLTDGIYSFHYNQNKSFNVQWIHADQTTMSYVLQEQGTYSSLGIDIRRKTGNYLTIGPSNHTITERTLTIWIDHGQRPYTLNCNYMILPNISLDLTPRIIKQYDEQQVFSCQSTLNHFHGTMWPTLKRASFVLWDNVSTTFSCKSSTFEINIQLNDAGAYLFSETEQYSEPQLVFPLSIFHFSPLYFVLFPHPNPQKERADSTASFGIFALDIKRSFKCKNCIRKKVTLFFYYRVPIML